RTGPGARVRYGGDRGAGDRGDSGQGRPAGRSGAAGCGGGGDDPGRACAPQRAIPAQLTRGAEPARGGGPGDGRVAPSAHIHPENVRPTSRKPRTSSDTSCGLGESLEHYDRRGLLQPAARDRRSGYRYYSAAQAAAARAIALLRSVDVPLVDIQELLASPEPELVRRVFAEHRLRVERRLTAAQVALESIDRIIKEGELMNS